MLSTGVSTGVKQVCLHKVNSIPTAIAWEWALFDNDQSILTTINSPILLKEHLATVIESSNGSLVLLGQVLLAFHQAGFFNIQITPTEKNISEWDVSVVRGNNGCKIDLKCGDPLISQSQMIENILMENAEKVVDQVLKIGRSKVFTSPSGWYRIKTDDILTSGEHIAIKAYNALYDIHQSFSPKQEKELKKLIALGNPKKTI